MFKYVITGGEGFIGTNLVNYLLQHHLNPVTDFVSLDLTASTIEGHLYHGLSFPFFFKAEHIIHLAAKTNVRESLEDPFKVFTANTRTVASALESARDAEVKSFVFASSAAAPMCQSPYLASKYAGEALCKAYRSSFHLIVHICRFANVYGPYSTHKQSVIHSLIKKAIKREPLQIFGDGKQTRKFAYVEDVVEAIFNLTNANTINEDLIIASEQSYEILKITEIIQDISKELLGYTSEINYLPPNEGEVLHPLVRANCIGKTSIEEGIRKTFEWYIDNYEINENRRYA